MAIITNRGNRCVLAQMRVPADEPLTSDRRSLNNSEQSHCRSANANRRAAPVRGSGPSAFAHRMGRRGIPARPHVTVDNSNRARSKPDNIGPMIRPVDNNEIPEVPDTDFEFLADSEVIDAEGLRTVVHNQENS